MTNTGQRQVRTACWTFVAVVGLHLPAASAQRLELVKDINTVPDDSGSSRPASGTVARQLLYFLADDGRHGRDIWVSDGSAEGTRLAADIGGEDGYVASGFTAFGDRVLFVANDGIHGKEPWVSDGTEEGTFLLRDIMSGAGDSIDNTYSEGYAVTDDLAFFLAASAEHGEELWVTDGTAEGTMILRDFCPGQCGSVVEDFGAAGEVLYVSVEDTVTGERELWVSDGTEDGTELLRWFATIGASYSRTFTPAGGWVYFAASDGVSGSELWRTNGTAGGTVQVADVNPGPQPSAPKAVTPAGDAIFFVAYDDLHGHELWRTDGTAGGTALVADIRPDGGAFSSSSVMMAALGNRVLFYADDGVHGGEVWLSDGTEGGTHLLDLNPGPNHCSFRGWFSEVGGLLYFSARDAEASYLWRSDGTEQGTSPLAPTRGCSTSGLGTSDGAVYFGCHSMLWRTDGTASGTVAVGDRESYELHAILGGVNGGVLFEGDERPSVHGRELWMSDGTDEGTLLLKDIYRESIESWPRELIESERYLFFSADDGVHGRELWRSDGTEDGTRLVADLVPGEGDGDPRMFASIGEVLLFKANTPDGGGFMRSDGTAEGTWLLGVPGYPYSPAVPWRDIVYYCGAGLNVGTELWATDGTPGGTVLVSDIHEGPDGGCEDVAAAEDYLVLSATEGTSGLELWISDGSVAGTRIVRDIRPGSSGSEPSNFAAIGNVTYFSANDGEHGRELWRSDGTPEGTRLVADLWPLDRSSTPWNLAPFGDALLFTAEDGIHGRELWITDGTAEGTSLIVDIAAGSASSEIRGLTASGGSAFFSAAGRLWRTDGTTSGTAPVSDDLFVSLSQRSLPLAIGPFLYFAGEENPWGREPWRTDAAAQLVEMVADVAPGWDDSYPEEFTLFAGDLYFSAVDDLVGRELWRIKLTPEPPRHPRGRLMPNPP